MLAFIGGFIIAIFTTTLFGHTSFSLLLTLGLSLAWGIGVGLLESEC